MLDEKFSRLIRQGFLSEKELRDLIEESYAAGKFPEEILMSRGIPKHEILFCLTEYYNHPFLEYDEDIIVSARIVKMLNLERMKKSLWVPLYFDNEKAEVAAYHPDSSCEEEIRRTLNVRDVSFLVAMPADIIRIIENNLDLNPNFCASGGRTSLARVRIFLAERRSMLASYRTSLAKGRTGLAFIRTGISFIAISIVLFRVFGPGYSNILEAALLLTGVVMTLDGFKWYLPARKTGRKMLDCSATTPTGGTTVLQMSNPGNNPCFTRSEVIDGAAGLRAGWCGLSPVMRRRVLAVDRTDLAEERTMLACHRTLMARGRNGLAFTRTGVAFAGLGIVLLKQFSESAWSLFDAGLIITGIVMAAEGFYWYMPGRKSGVACVKSMAQRERDKSIWEIFFPPSRKRMEIGTTCAHMPPVKSSYARGIWATTGLALERTMLADRRNIMARLRTVMARARTGLSLINTGSSIAAVGGGLLSFYGPEDVWWTLLNSGLIMTGILLVADGIYWYAPAEKARRQYPYCFGPTEIMIPDYGRPANTWKRLTIDDQPI